MKVAVTGANGLVGSYLCRSLEIAGHEVSRFQRNAVSNGGQEFDLDRIPESASLAGFDALIHCAYDFKALGWDEIRKSNVEGSIGLFNAAKRASVHRIIFISTISAFEGCKSHYGRGKLEVERAVRGHEGIVIRPGLVYGDPQLRGMFGTLQRLSSSSFLPVFSSGDQLLYPVHIDDLVAFTCRVLELFDEMHGRVFYAASSEPISFKRLLRAIASANGNHKIHFASVPGWVALAGLRMAEWLGLPLGFTSDNLVSLLNSDPAPRVAQNCLGIEFRRLDLCAR
jgi:nucleoside-diphosphate-sugar epimerase